MDTMVLTAVENVETLASILEGVDFSVLLAELKEVIKVILPVTIGFLGFRKAWAFFRGSIASA